MKTLEQIFSEHEGKVVDKWASYIEEYERLFASFRKEPIALLEIGVQNGGSLEVWDKYLSRAKAIVGCDIDPACQALQFVSDRIHIVIGDASTEQCAHQIAAIAPDFDIIIDDGSHVSKDIIATFSRYFSTLKNNGLYVIEDLHCSYWSNYQGGLVHPYSAVSFLKALADVLNQDHWGIARQGCEFLHKYSQHYGVQFDEDVLAGIHSITFLNSLCVIRKAAAEKNALGRRVVIGREAQVADAILPLAGQNLVSPDQGSEPWTRYAFSTQEQLIGRISDLDRVKHELDEQMATLSRSLLDRDGRIGALRQALSAREDELAALKQGLAERTSEIALLRQALSAREDELAALKHGLAERTSEIALLRQALAGREDELAALKQGLEERSSEIGVLRQALAVREAEANSLDATLSALHTSTSWRITTPLRAARRLSGSLSRSRLGYPLALAWRALRTRSRAPLRDWRDARIVGRSCYFDAQWYLANNPDVAEAGIDPALHYASRGWREGRNPGPAFDTRDYLAHNPDIERAGINPFAHYVMRGAAEARAGGVARPVTKDPVTKDIEYEIARLVTKYNRIFGSGWIFHPVMALSHLTLALRLADGTKASIPVQHSKASEYVYDAFPQHANAKRAGFVVYGGWRGGRLTETTMNAEFADGSIIRIAAPFVALDDDRISPPVLPSRGQMRRAWGLLKRGRVSALVRKMLSSRRVITDGTISSIIGEITRVTAGRRVLLIVDHNLGGGANLYREQLIAKHRAAGRIVLLLCFDLASMDYILDIRGAARMSFATQLEIVSQLAARDGLDEVFVNDAVSFPNPEHLARILTHLACAYPLPLTIAIHDYLTICPSQFLLNRNGRFCGVPPTEVCRTCLPENTFGFCSLAEDGAIESWRTVWRDCLAAASRILCFSNSSKELVRKAYPDLPEHKFDVRPHMIEHLPTRLPTIAREEPLHIGVVGHIGFHKGAEVVRRLAGEIEARRLAIRITIIGTVDADCNPVVVTSTGPYQMGRLPDLIENAGANLFLLPSICSETFSFVTQELIMMKLPVVCFDLGAPAERIAAYARGRVVPLGDASDLLDALIEFHASLQSRAMEGSVS